jgi:amyloid beta A4 precursor protein-binding family B member 2
MLNEAVDRLLSEVRRERWTFVNVHISPSAIIIFEAKGIERQIASCRVRYLSFLGIGRDTK